MNAADKFWLGVYLTLAATVATICLLAWLTDLAVRYLARIEQRHDIGDYPDDHPGWARLAAAVDVEPLKVHEMPWLTDALRERLEALVQECDDADLDEWERENGWVR